MEIKPSSLRGLKIVVIGGGTGSFTILSTLKNYSDNLKAIVNMVDDGGSTGVLRDELGVLPPGDVRQCLVALSDSDKIRKLFNYRFNKGTFKGHSFGNIFLTALEKTSGSFREAVKTASEILRINGEVIPATLDNVRLKMEWPHASLVLHGERVIYDEYFKYDPRRAILSLVPKAKANPDAILAIKQADLIVIAPGDLYSSLGPLLVIKGIASSIIDNKKAKCIYLANLVTKNGQTGGFTVSDHVSEIERFVGAPFLNYVIYNKQVPSNHLAKRYKAEKAYLTKVDTEVLESSHYKAIAGDYLGQLAKRNIADMLLPNRSLIRHDAESIIKDLANIVQSDKVAKNTTRQ